MARGMQEPLLSDGGDVEVGIGIRNDWAVERPAIAKVAPSRSPAEANRSPKDPLRRMHLQGNDMGAAWRLKVAGEESARRFSIMLVLSTGFLIAELVFGVLSGSLALMADAFHMISDVVAIVCGMWVARLSSRASSDEMSFGWRRAEIVGAFANGCFLLAVSFTIALEAIEKLAGLSGDSKNLEKNAFQVMCVGLAGVAINLFGMCVFGGHGHSHGVSGPCHSHGGQDAHAAASVPLAREARGGSTNRAAGEEGHGHGHGHEHGHGGAEAGGGGGGGGHAHGHEAKAHAGEAGGGGHAHGHDGHAHAAHGDADGHGHAHADGGACGGGHAHGEEKVAAHDHAHAHGGEVATQGHAHGAAAGNGNGHDHGDEAATHGHGHAHAAHENGHAHWGEGDAHGHAHAHAHGAEHGAKDGGCGGGGSHGHAHGGEHKMNMNEWSMYLHVMGDALGSAAVAASAAIIHYTDSPYRFLADPITSLFIVCIILAGTIPMLRTAALILLHATPDLTGEAEGGRDALYAKMRAIPGVLEVHELHLWQLNQATVICTAHVVMHADTSKESEATIDEMKELLHRNGIHSSTIQTEFVGGDQARLVGEGVEGTSTCADLVCSDDRCLADACCSVGHNGENGGSPV